jgi:vacuolar-type H+-ATPase subunit H
MAQHNGHSSAELEREVEAQRSRVESTIGEIKDRLTPGQLVDELLSYTKHGGAHFASNLGHTVTANPLPAALLGISLAWLMAGPKLGMGNGKAHDWSTHDYGFEPEYRALKGSSMQRVSHAQDESSGLWYSEFTDDSGKKYRARSDMAGNRMGHFMDDTGKAVAGFFDDTGKRIEQFRDEAGNLLDEASGWANHAWQDASWAASQRLRGIASSAAHLGSDVQHNAARLSRDAMHMLEDQPLVMGALAFAAGAALGAAVPHTRQEDELMGEMADKVKRQAGEVASDLYEQGKETAEEVYEDVTEKAGEVYDDAKRKLTGGAEQSGKPQGTIRH